MGKLSRVNKNINMKHDASEANNILDVDGANNAGKKAKIYESNLF